MNEHNENCVFCKIINKEIPSSIVYEDDKFFSFLDNNPETEGHTILIPKEHFRWMQDLPDDLLSEAFLKTKELMIKIKEERKCELVKIMVFGKDVPHFHIHLIPQYSI